MRNAKHSINRYLIFISLTALSQIIFLISCSPKKDSAEKEETVKTPVTITSVSVEPMTEAIELNAVSSFTKKNIIKSVTTGSVESIEINIGDHVEKGQELFTLKTKEASALERSSVTDSSLIFKGLIRIRASKTGIISSISHQKGDYVQDGEELAVIAEPSSLVFMLNVPFELTRYIRKNENCQILLSDNRKIEGTISSNLPAMDMTSQTENFIVKPSLNESLPENLMAKIKIIRKTIPAAHVLPKAAVLTNETQSEFWVMKLINDSIAVKIPVTKGIEDEEKTEIIQPVFSDSDRILLTGNYGLSDTAYVKINKQ